MAKEPTFFERTKELTCAQELELLANEIDGLEGEALRKRLTELGYNADEFLAAFYD